MAASSVVDEFDKSFEEDFCFVACMSSTTVSDMWFVDNGASCRMIGQGYRKLPPPHFEALKLDPGGCILEAPSEV
jgi:hypothetical protein